MFNRLRFGFKRLSAHRKNNVFSLSFFFFTDSCGDPTESFMRVQYGPSSKHSPISHCTFAQIFLSFFLPQKNKRGERHVHIGRTSSVDKEMERFYLPYVFRWEAESITAGKQRRSILCRQIGRKPQRPSRLAGENKRSSLTTFVLPNPVKEIKVSLLVELMQTKLFSYYANGIPNLVFSWKPTPSPFPFNSLISPISLQPTVFPVSAARQLTELSPIDPSW